MFYIHIHTSMTQENTAPKEVTDAPAHLFKLVNYIPTGGVLIVRKGVTEFPFVAA